MSLRYDHRTLWFRVGPWMARLILNPVFTGVGGFAYDITESGYGTRRYRFFRRFWSGWHRWDDEP